MEKMGALLRAPSVAVGIDLVRVSRIAASVRHFGNRFLRRVFTDSELECATSSKAETHRRLAARFAAKEATIKVLSPQDHGLGWRSIEVRQAPSGACELVLHGAARRLALRRGIVALALSLSHEDGYAAAVVVGERARRRRPRKG